MTEVRQLHTRRSAIVTGLSVIGASAPLIALATAAAASEQPALAYDPESIGDVHDWDWLVGHWSVKHRRLKGRLVGSTEWEEFDGTCVNWQTLGGGGNIDDNVLELPTGTYRGVGIRALDPKSGQWSIWWLDSRKATMDPPVRGGFKDGVGTFLGPDTNNGKPVTVRFRWSKITPNSAHWDQALSPDEGVTWEKNWDMEFTRVRT